MPRPVRPTPTSKRSVTLPDELWAFIDELGYDPVRKQTRYAFQAKFFERIVRQEKTRIEGVQSLAEEDKSQQYGGGYD